MGNYLNSPNDDDSDINEYNLFDKQQNEDDCETSFLDSQVNGNQGETNLSESQPNELSEEEGKTNFFDKNPLNLLADAAGEELFE